MDSKAECGQLNSARVTKKQKYIHIYIYI